MLEIYRDGEDEQYLPRAHENFWMKGIDQPWYGGLFSGTRCCQRGGARKQREGLAASVSTKDLILRKKSIVAISGICADGVVLCCGGQVVFGCGRDFGFLKL